MRRPIAPIACVLAILTGAWIGQAYALFAPLDPIAAEPDNTGAEAAVWRFYDAVDTMLRIGDEAPLRDAIAPDFVDHSARPGLSPTRDGLLAYLASLRQTHPGLSLAPRDLIIEGERVVAWIDLAGNTSGAFLGMPLAESPPWPSVDHFRIEAGRIAEHWDDAHGRAATELLVSTSLTVPAEQDLIPSLESVTLAPGATDRPRYWQGPAVMLVEIGSVDVAMDNVETALSPGEVLTVAVGTAVTMRNRTASPATVLVARLDAPRWPAAIGEPEAAPETPSTGVTIVPLAVGARTITGSGPHSVAIGRVTLEPGAAFAPHRTTGAELLVVDTGTLTVTLTGEASRAWIQSPGQGMTSADGLEQLAPDAGISISPGATASYGNDGTSALSLLVVTINPGTGSDPSAASA